MIECTSYAEQGNTENKVIRIDVYENLQRFYKRLFSNVRKL